MVWFGNDVARTTALKDLEEKLGHSFTDRKLLRRALTHASTRSEAGRRTDNERLEFLGDRVLGLVIAEWLQETFPEADEGDLAKRYNRLVRREACAWVARSLNLGDALVMSVAEADQGGRDKDTILADGCEAILGAVFLEAGYARARRLVRRVWQPRFDGASGLDADPKSALQEWAQGRGLPLPVYDDVARHGPDHAPKFTTEVRVSRHKPAQGQGSTKRAAQQAAAATMLERVRKRAEKGERA